MHLLYSAYLFSDLIFGSVSVTTEHLQGI